MAVARIVLAGDTMLGRGVAARLGQAESPPLFSPGVRNMVADADLFLVNLECCISRRGTHWPDKKFTFRAPPVAARILADLGVSCATLANNHSMDFGPEALHDTLHHLRTAGITAVGAGPNVVDARASRVFECNGLRLAILGITDHPVEFAAGRSRPGVAHVDLRARLPRWLSTKVRDLRQEVDVVLVTPHWGPNMVPAPIPQVRRAATDLIRAGATVIAGHSAHVFHGVRGPVLFDLGDFIDDYTTYPVLRNDLGLLFRLTIDRHGPIELDAVPIALDFCYTRLANRAEYHWIRNRFTHACATFGTHVTDSGNQLTVNYTRP